MVFTCNVSLFRIYFTTLAHLQLSTCVKLNVLSFITTILNIGIHTEIGETEQKVRKLFNAITFFGCIAGLLQVFIFIFVDKYAVLFHATWTVFCVIALLLHHYGYYHLAKITSVYIILSFGSLASARIGSEYYPHIASFGIVVSTFIFFDLKKEWGYIVAFLLLHAGFIVLIESNILQNETISIAYPVALRSTIIVGTALFIALEIYFIIQVTTQAQLEKNKKLRVKNMVLQEREEEKTVLLQELHHRVKNNLQMVVSLIQLQKEHIADAEIHCLFNELKERIIAMARMHEMMYVSQKIHKVDIKNYIEELATTLISSSENQHPVELKVHSHIKYVSARDIVPIALILNELITNSIKHAFTAKNNLIEVSIGNLNDHRIAFYYSDNGSWKNPSEENSGFGLELIELLTEQMDGFFKRENLEAGTRYEFVFNLSSKGSDK